MFVKKLKSGCVRKSKQKPDQCSKLAIEDK